MSMTDKEQSFLEYMVSRGQNCTDNMLNIIEDLNYESKPKRIMELTSVLNYHRGCLETYTDLIEAYKHNFDDK